MDRLIPHEYTMVHVCGRAPSSASRVKCVTATNKGCWYCATFRGIMDIIRMCKTARPPDAPGEVTVGVKVEPSKSLRTFASERGPSITRGLSVGCWRLVTTLRVLRESGSSI